MNMTTPPKRGEIWRANLEPTEGDEIRKTRPVVIISREKAGKLNLRVVVPITDWNPSFANYPWMVRLNPDAINGLSKTSAADNSRFALSHFRASGSVRERWRRKH